MKKRFIITGTICMAAVLSACGASGATQQSARASSTKETASAAKKSDINVLRSYRMSEEEQNILELVNMDVEDPLIYQFDVDGSRAGKVTIYVQAYRNGKKDGKADPVIWKNVSGYVHESVDSAYDGNYRGKIYVGSAGKNTFRCGLQYGTPQEPARGTANISEKMPGLKGKKKKLSLADSLEAEKSGVNIKQNKKIYLALYTDAKYKKVTLKKFVSSSSVRKQVKNGYLVYTVFKK